MRSYALALFLTLILFPVDGLSQNLSYLTRDFRQATTLKGQFHGMSYASDFQGKSTESRYRITLKKIDIPFEGFQNSLHLDIWGLIPQESPDWFDLPEAYISYRKNNFIFKLGRVQPKWGTVDFYSPTHSIFSSFSIDPMSQQRDGLIGLYSSYQRQQLTTELMLSPMFIPNRGGVRFQKDEGGRFYSPSRWGPTLYYRILLDDGWIPLNYDLHLPAVKSVLFNPGMVLRFKYSQKKYDIALLAANLPNPEARLRLDPKLYIKDETTLKTKIHIYPEFYNQRTLGLEGTYKLKNVKIMAESVYVNHENPEDISKLIYLPSQLKSLFAVSFQKKNAAISQLIAGIQGAIDLDNKTALHLTQSEKSEVNLFSRIGIHPFQWLDLSLFSEADIKFQQALTRGALNIRPFKKTQISVGIDIIVGKDNTYWGQFRSNDRQWIKLRYAL